MTRLPPSPAADDRAAGARARARRRRTERRRRGRRHGDGAAPGHRQRHRQPDERQRDHQLEHVQHRRGRDARSSFSRTASLDHAQPRHRRARAVDDLRHARRQRPRLHHQPRRHPVRAERGRSTPRASSPPRTTSRNQRLHGRPLQLQHSGPARRLDRQPWAPSRRRSGGFAALVAPGVRNSGTITATLGTVTLASGNSFTLDFYGDKLISSASATRSPRR